MYGLVKRNVDVNNNFIQYWKLMDFQSFFAGLLVLQGGRTETVF